ncbi:universal stress protein [Bacillaceae bacterium CLA-AA-H227]|uniref:Universal stress protein n=1 Tax=Robertmurraya yapensis (ex Hitch et al 2024) TaxID=3133160 RepID=A0ACC6SEM2_9BACI
MYKKIMLAMDGSEHSLRAANEAIKMAALDSESKIEMVYVADFAKAKSEVLHAQGREDLEHARRIRLQPVEDLMKSNKITYNVQILHGEPGPELVKYANKEKFDLVVIGSRGLNALQEMVLGSVSHKVVKRANCPVLVVK